MLFLATCRRTPRGDDPLRGPECLDTVAVIVSERLPDSALEIRPRIDRFCFPQYLHGEGRSILEKVAQDNHLLSDISSDFLAHQIEPVKFIFPYGAGVVDADALACDDISFSHRRATVFEPKAGFLADNFSILTPVYL